MGADGIAMGTRFLMTEESPVPALTKVNYMHAAPEQIQISTKLDGLPQRMIDNPCLDKLNHTSTLGMWLLAVKNGLAFSSGANASLLSSLKSAWAISRTGDLSWAQTLMAANAPMMIQEAMVNGHPDRGILPSGQVAGIISDQPTVEALIASIVAEADQAIAELAALAGLSTLASAAATTLNPTQD
jgi:NAD(P)H-dependent flavin oxidoreductase YrpB (nitropropane dioxygenase family)